MDKINNALNGPDDDGIKYTIAFFTIIGWVISMYIILAGLWFHDFNLIAVGITFIVANTLGLII